MSDDILSREEVERLAHRGLDDWVLAEAKKLIRSHESLRAQLEAMTAERDRLLAERERLVSFVGQRVSGAAWIYRPETAADVLAAFDAQERT